MHPEEVYDSTVHCPGGDDEMLCDIGTCLQGCDCQGYAMSCMSKGFIKLSWTFANVKFLNLQHNALKSVTLSPVSAKHLIYLDISHNKIQYICEIFNKEMHMTSVFTKSKYQEKLNYCSS